MDALMSFEIEACLACVSAKERKTSLDAFEKRNQ
jgi:enoyl-CoA hydratase